MAKKKVAKETIDITGVVITDEVCEKIVRKVCKIYPSEEMLEKYYHGCGHGFVIIRKDTGQVTDMAYTHNGKRINEQNIFMCDDAGKILRDTKKHLKVRANFSCCMACLF
jgi:hypothetical protein